MVPTVSLEWVVGTLLGKKSIEFLKIDAQGQHGVAVSQTDTGQLVPVPVSPKIIQSECVFANRNMTRNIEKPSI